MLVEGAPMAFFAVIIATRNRPGLFRQALQSVLAQSFSDIEVIIVNDGSAEQYQAEYASILGFGGSSIRSFALIPRPMGMGVAMHATSARPKRTPPISASSTTTIVGPIEIISAGPTR
jgi:Glycosyl transferase family 2